MAKVRHAAVHDPSSLWCFVIVGIRLLIAVPLWHISRLLNIEALRIQVLHSVVQDALIASERCNRVERRRALEPLGPTDSIPGTLKRGARRRSLWGRWRRPPSI